MSRNLKWDQRFMDLAKHVASWSRDPSTRVGRVIVGTDRRDVVLAYNGFPPGIADTPERLNNREEKYFRVVHAERNALDHARFDTRGASLYSTLCPCPQCAASIVSKGIGRVVCPKPDHEGDQYRRWRLDVALDMLNEAKVIVEWDVPA